jgi:hypothetical protein
MLSRDQDLGKIGEIWAYNELKKRGWPVKMMADFKEACCDMKIGNLPIEVKYALPTYRVRKVKGLQIHYARWQWFVHPTYESIKRDWVLILIAEDQKKIKYHYILPGNLLDGRNHLQLTSHPKKYGGWLNDWRDEWGVIDFLCQQSYLDGGPTYQQWKAGNRIVA